MSLTKKSYLFRNHTPFVKKKKDTFRKKSKSYLTTLKILSEANDFDIPSMLTVNFRYPFMFKSGFCQRLPQLTTQQHKCHTIILTTSMFL